MAFGSLVTVSFVFIVIAVIASTAVILFGFIRAANVRNKNDHSPQLTVPALLVAKRMKVSGDACGIHGSHMTSSTWYFATFQFASGDRMEFRIDGSEYGMIVEGDEGDLTFQGTRYLGFERRR